MNIMLSDCVWDKRTAVLVYQKGVPKYPMNVFVVSEKTGKVVLFTKDVEKAERMEFWDGEMCEYIPDPNQVIKTVKTLILR